MAETVTSPLTAAARAAVDCLVTRRSVSPKRLVAPGPTREALGIIIDAALRAPDHGDLKPWRVIEFPQNTRAHLADLFEAEKRRRDPIASTEDISRAREHALHPPVALGFVVRTQKHPLVPVAEQMLSAGAALGSLLLATHALGFGAMVLSGERCQDQQLLAALGVGREEVLGGFISIGTVEKRRPVAAPQPRERVFFEWQPQPVVPATAYESVRG